ncbi:MAG: hypothetical protein JOZ91_09840 [Candidatus Eremiobacteraeota bacterium]|nr:hypothetical protein [Candidatus Eremiobacteraeota bacterium]
MNIFQQMTQHPGKPPDPSAFGKLQTNGALTAFEYIFAFCALPIAQAAVVAAVSRAYLSLPVDFRDSYRFAMSRWLAIFILIVLWVLFAFAVVMVVAIVVLFFAFTIGFVFTRAAGGSNPFLAGGASIFFIVCVIVGAGAGAMLYLSYALSFIAVMVERVDPLAAFASGFRRILYRDQVWRALAVALGLFAINVGTSLVTLGAGALGVLLLKTPALYAISVGLLSLFFTPFALVTAAVFYYDIRIRHEGYDLQMMADRFAAPAATTPTSP